MVVSTPFIDCSIQLLVYYSAMFTGCIHSDQGRSKMMMSSSQLK